MPEPTPAPESQTPTPESPPEDFDFDGWFDKQPAHIQKGYEKRTQGLHSALQSEREQRKELAKELKKLGSEATDATEAKKALGEISTRLEVAEQRAAFYEDASKPEIGCTNIKTAFLVAQAEGLFKRTGEPDWPAIKATAPELFGSRKTPAGNAGSGNGSPPATKGGMNEWIRQAARGG